MRKYRRRASHLVAILVIALSLIALPFVSVSHAGIGDRLKKKVEEKVEKKAADKANETTNKPAEETSEGAGETSEAEPAPAKSDGAAGKGGAFSSVSTKFDYVPGDSVLLYDDFSQDELGEFPARWKLSQGTFEVVEAEGERWLRCTSTDGRVRMKLPAMASLPEFWTLDFEFYGKDLQSIALTVRALNAGGNMVWESSFPHSAKNMAFWTGDIMSTTPLEGGSVDGRHHVMFMARGTALKAYLDRQRMVNVPEISTTAGPPQEIEIRLWSGSMLMITNVRFAEGCRPAKDLLDSGKLVTHGIHFQTGSDIVLPDSAPVLRQVASYMEANPTVKLHITGHTDNSGTAAGNMDLSQRRAAAVAAVLSDQLAIARERLSTGGKGDTEPVSPNAKPEGRAMNRRVEFAKS